MQIEADAPEVPLTVSLVQIDFGVLGSSIGKEHKCTVCHGVAIYMYYYMVYYGVLLYGATASVVYVPVKLPSKLLQYSYDMDHYHNHLQYDDYFPAADGMISHMVQHHCVRQFTRL